MIAQRKGFAARRQNHNRILKISCLLLLCASGIFAYCYHSERNAVSEIKTERDALARSAKNLESNYRELKEAYDALNKNNIQSNREYNSLKRDYDALKNKSANLESNYRELKEMYDVFDKTNVQNNGEYNSLKHDRNALKNRSSMIAEIALTYLTETQSLFIADDEITNLMTSYVVESTELLVVAMRTYGTALEHYDVTLANDISHRVVLGLEELDVKLRNMKNKIESRHEARNKFIEKIEENRTMYK